MKRFDIIYLNKVFMKLKTCMQNITLIFISNYIKKRKDDILMLL